MDASKPPRIYLSPPDIGPDERALVAEAFASNWIAPLGPQVDAFEREFAEAVGGGARGGAEFGHGGVASGVAAGGRGRGG